MVARAIADGPRPAMALNAGVVTGDLLFFSAAVAGMAAAAHSLGELFAVLRFLGAAYLLRSRMKQSTDWAEEYRKPVAGLPPDPE